MKKGSTNTLFLLVCITFSAITINAQSVFLKDYRLSRVTDDTPLPPSNSVSQISISDSVIWIGTSKGVGKSLNGGRSWKSFSSNPAFANQGIFSLAVRNDTIWTSTGYEKKLKEGSVQTGSGYTFSTNGGITWQHIGQTLDQRGDSIISYCIDNSTCINDSIWILPIVVSEQNVTFDIALSSGTVWIASWASGLRKSTDQGQTWQRILLPPDNRNSLKPTDTLWTYAATDTHRQRRIFHRFDPRRNNNFLAFAVYAQDSDTIWCGTAGGVNKSTDGGKSWVKFNRQNQASPILGNWVIAIDQQRWGTKQRIWTTNWRADDPNEQYGVSYSDDGGKSWTNILHNIKAYDFAFKDSIAYIATVDGLYRTYDGGKSFIKTSSIYDPSTRQVIASPSVYSVGVIGDTVFVGTADGLASTIDNDSILFGTTWKIFRAYQQVGNAALTYAYPNPFSPALEPVRIHYGLPLSSSPQTVSIDIFDFGMNRVRTLINRATRSGVPEFDELWDGRDDDGRIVANGVYFYRIKIDGHDSLYGKILVLQ